MRRLPFFVVLLAGCTKLPTHPPYANSSCLEPPCVTGPAPVGGGPTTDAAVPGVDASTPLEGNVGVFDDAAFVSTSPFLGSGSIDVFGPNGPKQGVTATFTDSHYFVDAQSSAFWAEMEAVSAADLLPTLSPIGLRRPASADVAFARETSFADVFSGLVNRSLSMRTDRAQIVLKFVDGANKALPGVHVTVVPTGATIAYDDGALYSERSTLTATQSRGIAVVLNAAAPPWPGDYTALKYESGSPVATYLLDVYVAVGAVTVITVPPALL